MSLLEKRLKKRKFMSSSLRRLIFLSLSFYSLALVIYVLYIGSSFFIPLSIAIVICYLFIAIAEGIMRIRLGGKLIPKFLAFFISFGLFALGTYLIVFIMKNNITTLVNSSDAYQHKLNAIASGTSSYFGLNQLDFSEFIGRFDFSGILKSIIVTLTEIASHTGIIIICIIFIMIEYSFIDDKLNALFPNQEHRHIVRRNISKINEQILSYFRIKTLFSLSTAICSYIVLKFVGVDFADFWAMLIFLFNYIPTVGSIVATFLPCMLAILQFDTFAPFFITLASLSAIQFTFGNIIEPRVMGEKFNLSGLVIILSLAIWGKIWGVIGMFLCMPLLMILNIILSNFPQTRPIVILLSRNGEIEKNKI